MANFRYFADINGQAFELSSVWHNGSNSTKASAFTGLAVAGQRVSATRKVEYKANPSKHECDARCMHATGKIMKCECSCGGKNHGRGSFACEAA
jgi:hypothetical protein